MKNKTNTRVTVDIPITDHKKLTLLAALHGKSMREIFVEVLGHGLKHYQECPENHEPNKTTAQALEKATGRKGLQKAATVKELFKKLSELAYEEKID